MPLTELSAMLSELGQPIPVLGLRRIESGDRRLEPNEVTALARALDTVPLLLLFPVGTAPTTEVLPGMEVDTWRAARWFTGRGTLGDERASAEVAVLHLFEEHDRLVAEVDEAKVNVELWPGPADDEKRTAARRFRLALRDLRHVRAQMRQRDITPPALDEFLAVVDSTDTYFVTSDELASLRVANSQPVPPAGTYVQKMPDGTLRPVNFRGEPLDSEMARFDERTRQRARELGDLLEGPDEAE